jgi:hypothetical protein
MIKGIMILMGILGAIILVWVSVTATPTDREQYEAYERWKERKRNERSD